MAKLFTTKTRRTYHRTQPKRGWSTTLTAHTRLKRWARRKVKKLWRTIRSPKKLRLIRRVTRVRTGGHATRASAPRPVHPSYQSDSGTLEGQVKLPPPDGAIASCRRCSNEVMYSDAHGRWEHPGHGNWECFQPHRS